MIFSYGAESQSFLRSNITSVQSLLIPRLLEMALLPVSTTVFIASRLLLPVGNRNGLFNSHLVATISPRCLVLISCSNIFLMTSSRHIVCRYFQSQMPSSSSRPIFQYCFPSYFSHIPSSPAYSTDAFGTIWTTVFNSVSDVLVEV